MPWLAYIAFFFGGLFLSNAVPHLVAGTTGRPFQSPFAKPSGVGMSSSTVNVAWGFANLVVAWLLLARVGDFALRHAGDVAAAGAGAFLMALFSASYFGRFHGGSTPQK